VCVLRDGRLQQVDTPQKLFESPVNLFVAGFIGSPAMNFVLADLVHDDGTAVSFAGYTLPVPADILNAKPGLSGYLGKKIILGIRPSDFGDAALADPGWRRMPVTTKVEQLRLGGCVRLLLQRLQHGEHERGLAVEVGRDLTG
jgi:multiple sugar transport system ATP-binding protein